MFYSFTTSKTKPKESIGNLSKPGGDLTTSDKEKADILNTFFSSVFTQENTQNIPEFLSRCSKELKSIVVTEEQIDKALVKLNSNKACGPDGIHPKFLKELHSSLSVPLCILFNKTMSSGTIPTQWKTAEVKPIFKKGEKQNPGNYRPVSLTSIVCKIFEGFIRDALNPHLTENKLLSEHQFGFTTGRSCITQLLVTIDNWMKNLDEGKSSDAIYLDLQKAFDKVPHKRLITKLEGYGIKGNLLNWINDFLSSRQQYVKVGQDASNMAPVYSGVPQGSVLGPTLFIYYINDMPDILNSLIKIFADDTKIYASVDSISGKEELQDSIDRLQKWSEDWQIKFNSTKCKVLHIGKNNPKYEYFMNGMKLEETTAEKDLGVVVDSNLTFDVHVNETVKKANRLCGMINTYVHLKKPFIMAPLFKTLVRPILEYGNCVWNSNLRKHVDLVEGVQRRYTKRIIGLSNLEYYQRLEKLKLPSLEFRRLRGDCIELFKMTHDMYDSSTISSLFSLNDRAITRGHAYKLTKNSVNTTKYANFFPNKIINFWNNLPNHIVSASTVNRFKNTFDSHYYYLMYKTNLELH